MGVLLWQQSLPLLALVDSGADENFLDVDLVTEVHVLAHVTYHTKPPFVSKKDNSLHRCCTMA